MRRILVTGASGLLGLNVALELAKDHVVIGQVNQHVIKTGAFAVEQVDLLAPGAVESLLERTQPDWVIHCAALAVVDACQADPALARQLNTEVPRKLAVHVARGGARLLHVSTDAVFDGQKGDYTEQDAPHPLSVYAKTKLAGERAVAQADPQAIIARTNIFGWSLSGRRSLAEFFFYRLEAGEKTPGFMDVYFCPILTNRLAQIFSRMLAQGLSGLYHTVGRDCLSKYEFGVALARRFGFDTNLVVPSSVAQAGLKAARSPLLTLKSDKLTRALGSPPPDLSTSLGGFSTLYQQGYPQFLKDLGTG
jgi:dTDP-4-dehydrorhamnose reductase